MNLGGNERKHLREESFRCFFIACLAANISSGCRSRIRPVDIREDKGPVVKWKLKDQCYAEITAREGGGGVKADDGDKIITATR